MDPTRTFCLAAMVLLSLSVPLLVSVVISDHPARRRLFNPCIWTHVAVCSIMGLVIITTSYSPLVPLLMASVVSLLCGRQVVRQAVTLSKSLP